VVAVALARTQERELLAARPRRARGYHAVPRGLFELSLGVDVWPVLRRCSGRATAGRGRRREAHAPRFPVRVL